jgi:HlyD family secretion protein
MKWVKRIAIALVVLIILNVVASWYKKKSSEGLIFEQGQLTKIVRGDLSIPISATGTIEPLSKTEIKCKSSGTVQKIYFNPGDLVRKGQLLVELDPLDEQRTLANTEAELARARANVALMQSQLDKALLDCPTQISRALAALGAARADLQQQVLNFHKYDLMWQRKDTSAARVKILDESTVPLIELKAEKDEGISAVLIDQARRQISVAAAESSDASQLVDYGRTVVRSNTTLKDDNSAASFFEYQSSVIMLWKAQAALDNAVASVRDAVASLMLINQARQQLAVAQRVENQAKIACDVAQQRLDETKIYAPIDGQILDVEVREGQIISSGVTTVTGGTRLMILADVSRLFVEAEVDEADIGRVRDLAPAGRAGTIVPLTDTQRASTQPINDTERSDVAMLRSVPTVNISVDAFREENFTGKIDRVYPNPRVANNVVTYNVRILLTSDNREKLMLGMHANVEFTAQQRRNVLLVDIGAIKPRNEKHGVYIPAPGEPKFIEIKLGDAGPDQIEIRSDELKEGQEVYIELPKSKDKDKAEEE